MMNKSVVLMVVILAALSSAEYFRPPAVPLINIDPLTNVYSMGDHLYDDWPKLWDGQIKALSGYLRVDGKPFRFMGPDNLNIKTMPTMTQTRLDVYATRTVYEFTANAVVLRVSFITPLIAEGGYESLMLPVSYIDFEIKSLDGVVHKVEAYVDATAEWVVNNVDEYVNVVRSNTADIACLKMGSRDQNILGLKGDGVGINWGFAYWCTDANMTSIASANESRTTFVSTGILPSSDRTDFPCKASDRWPTVAFRMTAWSRSSWASMGRVMMAYDDIKSIRYFERDLEPYWRVIFGNVEKMIITTWNTADKLIHKCVAFDDAHTARLSSVAGPEYAAMGNLAYRQIIAGGKVVVMDNKPMYFVKEISSDGDLSTVDVIYPTYPFYLITYPPLLWKVLEPVMMYAVNNTNPSPSISKKYAYNKVFAPHHLGYYPIGDIMPNEQEDMPMEESANMLILLSQALTYNAMTVNDLSPYDIILKQWADHLVSTLPDPGNQLCTDDFEGPAPHNVNLALKGIIGLYSYADICKTLHHYDDAAYYTDKADGFFTQWKSMGVVDGHNKLQYDLPNSWSLAYNWYPAVQSGHLLDEQELLNSMLKFDATHSTAFGIPLDNRMFDEKHPHPISKFDWMAWAASMALVSNDPSVVDIGHQMVHQLYVYTNTTYSRVPLSDWYDTSNGRQTGFQARPVVGGLFAISLLHDKTKH